ncbi:hypothetical protein [Bacillus clarus]|nr:hypothetical protein [Bacillus clarus]
MTLVLPANYIEIEEKEMEYIDGGYYIDHDTLQGIIFSAGGATAGVSVAAITAAIDGIAVAIAAIPGLGWVTGAILATYAGSFAATAANALWEGKGMNIRVGLG